MIECDKCKAQMEQTAKEEHIPNTELDINTFSVNSAERSILYC